MLTTTTAKTPPNVYMGYNPTLPATGPAGYASATLWIGALSDGGRYLSNDAYDPFGPNAMPAYAGMGFSSAVDRINGLHFTQQGNSLFRNLVVDSDATVGLHVINRRIDTAASPLGRASTQTWDYMHQDATFTMLFIVNFDTNATEQVLFTNTDGSSAAGVSLRREATTNKLTCFIRNAGEWRTANTPTWNTATFANDTWYLIAVVGHGDGQNLELKYAPFPGDQLPPTALTSENSINVVGGDDNTDASTTVVRLFSDHNDNSAFDGRFKDVMFFNEALSDAQILSLADAALWSGTASGEDEMSASPHANPPPGGSNYEGFVDLDAIASALPATVGNDVDAAAVAVVLAGQSRAAEPPAARTVSYTLRQTALSASAAEIDEALSSQWSWGEGDDADDSEDDSDEFEHFVLGDNWL
jgi:hypothetical protein